METQPVASDVPKTPEVNMFKVYTKNHVSVSTFLGGPLVGCYMMSKNFENFGDKPMAKKVLLIGLAYSALLVGVYPFVVPPQITSKINFGLPVAHAIALNSYAVSSQGKNVEDHIKNGGKTHSGWKAFGVIILSYLTYVGIIIVSSLVQQLLK